MVIKDKKEFKFNLIEFITGSPKNGYVGTFLFPTIVLTIVSILISTIYFVSIDTHNKFYLDQLLTGLVMFSGIGLGLAVLSLIAYNDWCSYGYKIWYRVVLYNIILLVASTYFSNNAEMDKISETVTTMSFVKSDTNRCENAIRMTTNQMQYTYCGASNSEFDRLKENKDLKIQVIGVKKYGRIVPLNMEIVEKTVTIK